jgi:hypothetical protein
MLTKSKLYKSVSCNRDVVAELVGSDLPEDFFGFVLIDKHIVPNSFIDFVADAISSTTFPYGAVVSVRDYVTEPLWEGLDDDERQVLGGVIMLLIEQGRVAVEFTMDECDSEYYSKGAKKH